MISGSEKMVVTVFAEEVVLAVDAARMADYSLSEQKV